MALIRWEPARELHSVQNEINRLFNTLFENPAATAAPSDAQRRWIPAMDLVEGEHEYVLKADLPGLGENDVKLEVQDNVLTVSGERRSEHEDRRGGYYRVERAFGSFSRSLTLPDGVDPADVKASFDKGVLEIRIPKPAQRKPHKIQIAVGGGQAAQMGAGSQDTIEGTATRPAPEPAAA